jgi:hypothetical protein
MKKVRTDYTHFLLPVVRRTFTGLGHFRVLAPDEVEHAVQHQNNQCSGSNYLWRREVAQSFTSLPRGEAAAGVAVEQGYAVVESSLLITASSAATFPIPQSPSGNARRPRPSAPSAPASPCTARLEPHRADDLLRPDTPRNCLPPTEVHRWSAGRPLGQGEDRACWDPTEDCHCSDARATWDHSQESSPLAPPRAPDAPRSPGLPSP